MEKEKIIIEYTNYKLKPENEIEELLKGTKSIYIFWCKKCFTKATLDEPFPEIIGKIKQEKKVDFSAVDFLCNNYHINKIIEDIDFSSFEVIGVISCGIGIQLVSDIIDNKIVIALSDTISFSENSTNFPIEHGISLSPEKCGGCGQCYLNITGGICPIINCAKGLLNGPCGGADKNGMCEVNKNKKCAWIEIYERLKKQKEKLNPTIEIRNYNIIPDEEKEKRTDENIERRQSGFYGGLYPEEEKEKTENIKIKKYQDPPYVIIFLSQHTGIPSIPIVKVGDKVKVGQKIGSSSGFISSNIHSSISGKVLSIEEKIHPVSLTLEPAIVIENNGLDDLSSEIQPLENWYNLPKEKILDFINEKGIVGLGGAMFPTHVKLSPPKKVDTLIVNGCECEPFLNSDNRVMIEYYREIIKGIEIVKKILEVKNVIVGIEDNKKVAINLLKQYSSENIKISQLPTKYPEGAEKILIKCLTGRQVPKKGLPFDVGVVVLNISTILAIYRAINYGFPLISRVITISGEDIKMTGNYEIKIGFPLKHIIPSFIDENEISEYDIKMGGPMMGICQENFETAVIKGTTGYTFLKKTPVNFDEDRNCIKCGRCVDACPVELYPFYFALLGQEKNFLEMGKYNVNECIECGCCQYICSSKINLLKFIKEGKKCLQQK